MAEGSLERVAAQAGCTPAANRFPDRPPEEAAGPCRHKDKSPRHRSGDCAIAAKGPDRHDLSLPKHVRNCANRGGRDWWLWSWRHAAPELKIRRPYTCGSWRCDGACARHNSHTLFARLRSAVSDVRHHETGWCFLVLTIDRNGYYSGKPWPDAQTAYRALSTMTGKFLKRLRRACVKRGWADPRNQWAMVIESHMSGWPHANLMLYSPELAAELRTETFTRTQAGAVGREQIILGTEATPDRGDPNGVRAWIGGHAVATDWGLESTADAARSTEALAGYLVKMASDPDANVGELAKLTQVPKSAPFRFRRLRSGKGFLPPVKKNEDFTGALVKRVEDWQTGYTYAMVPEPKGGHSLERRPAVALAVRLEDRVLEQDEERRWYERRRSKRGPPAIPLLTRWQGEQMITETRPEPTTWEGVRAEALDILRRDRKRRMRSCGCGSSSGQSLGETG